jgi:MoaA/NifB/PqqE/SkfB family radical SAM enzyme
VFPDADNDTKLKSIELKLGAKCNLECRTCSPNSSNKLLKEGSYERFGKVDKDWIRYL